MDKKTNHICVNIDDETMQKVSALARATGRTKTNIIYMLVINNIDRALLLERQQSALTKSGAL